MFDEVSRIGNASFILNGEGELLNKAVNADFQLVEDFFDTEASQVDLGNSSSDHLEMIDSGTILVSNSNIIFTEQIHVYLARFRKGQCDWESVVFYDYYNGSDSVSLDSWSFFYSNDNYVVYKIYSQDLPSTLPYDGDYPPSDDAEFIRYEKYTNVLSRSDCEFEYNTVSHSVELVDEPGDDTWDVFATDDPDAENEEDEVFSSESIDLINEDDSIDSSSESFSFKKYCKFTYTKSTPVGCDKNPPSLSTADFSDCDCFDSSENDFLFSSSSQSSSSLSGEISPSSLSSVSDGSLIEYDQKIQYDPNEESRRKYFVDQEEIYLKIDGEPFTGEAYRLYKKELESSSSSSSDISDPSSTTDEDNSSSSLMSSSSSLSSSSSSDSSSSSSSSRLDGLQAEIVASWYTNSFNDKSMTEGWMRLDFYDNGTYSLNAVIEVNNVDIRIDNAYLNDMYYENIISEFESTKGVFDIPLSNIIINLDDKSNIGFDGYLSLDSMYKESNGALKKVSEIVFDYERNEMVQDEYASYIDLMISDTDVNNGRCRSTGSFRLENIRRGEWYYKNQENEETRLTMSMAGRWTLYRKYLVGDNEFATMNAHLNNIYCSVYITRQ
jgi:hypothetical protein